MDDANNVAPPGTRVYVSDPFDDVSGYNVTCGVCGTFMDDPCSFIGRCAHVLCRRCLRSHIEAGGTACPFCRSEYGSECAHR